MPARPLLWWGGRGPPPFHRRLTLEFRLAANERRRSPHSRKFERRIADDRVHARPRPHAACALEGRGVRAAHAAVRAARAGQPGGDPRRPGAGKPRVAGQVRPCLSVARRVGPGAGTLRRAGADLRHRGHLADRDADRHPGELRHRAFPDRAVTRLAQASAGHRDRAARGNPLDHLRHVGAVRADAPVPGARAAGADRIARRPPARGRAVPGSAARHRHAHRGAHSFRHGDSLHRRRDARRVRPGAGLAEGIGLRTGGDDLGGGVEGRPALHQGRSHRRHHARPGARARGNDGGHFRDRQCAPAVEIADGTGKQHCLGAGQRVYRGGRRCVFFLAHGARPDPVSPHHVGSRARQAPPPAPGAARRSARMSAVVSPMTSAISPANPLYRSRKRVNVFMLGVSGLALVFGLCWLLWILGTLFYEGGHALARAALYFEMTPPPGADGGLANAIAGSAVLIAVATLLGTPVGILTGTYLAEFGKRGWIAPATRFINDVLLSAPSIVIGLFVYSVYVVRVKHFSGWAGAPAAPILQTRPSPVVPSPVQRLPSRSNARPFVPGTPDTNALANGTAAQSVAAESSDWQPMG